MKYDLVILTDRRYVNPEIRNPYVNNVLLEDELVQKAFERRGLKCRREAWDNPIFDWSSTRFALFRTTWDYFDRYNEFSRWLDQVNQQTQLINSEQLIRWNVDKHYLADLQQAGVHIAPTLFIDIGSKQSLIELHKSQGWTHTVLKPVVSGGGRHTYQLKQEDLVAFEPTFRKLIRSESYMLQPFQKNIVSQGELSLMIIDGHFTHAVKKIAKEGDFRVQDDFGGTVHPHIPSQAEIAFAEKAVAACHEKPVYARVDIFYDNDNQLAIAELELIEPELWFRLCPEAADRLADGIDKLRT
ncbi:hypothetical protein MWU59_06315 [Flavobacteriaceae bacterium F08102]|nr:hypothetical protein [Flavobacteriaceae bacterium F08102]